MKWAIKSAIFIWSSATLKAKWLPLLVCRGMALPAILCGEYRSNSRHTVLSLPGGWCGGSKAPQTPSPTGWGFTCDIGDTKTLCNSKMCRLNKIREVGKQAKKNQEQAWNETTTGEERTRLGGWIYMMRILPSATINIHHGETLTFYYNGGMESSATQEWCIVGKN